MPHPGEVDPALVARAAAILRRGGLVAFPTETVYGLGADATSPAALDRLFVVKGRPRTHPLIVHLGDAAWLDDWTCDVPEAARRLAARCWPGPLTLVLRRSPRVPDAVTGGQDTVGVRVPHHPVALALLAAFGSAIAAPSANRFGRVSPTTAAHVTADLGTDVDLVIDGGSCDVGIESSIVDLTGPRPVLLRPGRVTSDEIAAIVGAEVDHRAHASAARAPGTLEAHYAPRTPLAVLSGPDLSRARPAPGPIAVLAFERPAWIDAADVVRLVEPDASRYTHDLYAVLRELDLAGASMIVVEAPPAGPEWVGVADRLRRAARASRG